MSDHDASQFLEGLQRAGDEQRRLAALGIERFALFVLGDAQDNCPVDAGDLKASATDRPIERLGGGYNKVIGFNRFYAAVVHEVIDTPKGVPVNHPQGQAKYLELAMRGNAPKFGPYVAGFVKGGGQ